MGDANENEGVTSISRMQWNTGKTTVVAVKDLALHEGKKLVAKVRGGAYRRLVCDSFPRCKWFVNISQSQRTARQGVWRVSSMNLEHRDCISVASVNAKQLVVHPVLRADIVANPDVSTRALVSQLWCTANIVCSESKMYRAKQHILDEVFCENLETIRCLPSLLRELQRQNDGVYTELEKDNSGHFKRAIIVFNSNSFTRCQPIFGADAAHMKHRKCNGVQVVLVGRDRNLKNRIAAVALVPIEDHDNYACFFSRVMNNGFDLDEAPGFSDRHKGILSASNDLSIFNIFCVRHIIGDMRVDQEIKLSISTEKFVWGANAATTKPEFDKAMRNLKAANPAAATYLTNVPPVSWTLYPHYHVTPLFDWRTTNFVESEQARALKLQPRQMLPYEFFRAYTTIALADTHTRLNQVVKWELQGSILTPRAENKFQNELRQVPSYVVVTGPAPSAHVSWIGHPLRQREVYVQTPNCSCMVWIQHKLPCRHILAVLTANKSLNTAFGLVDDCYKVCKYREGLLPISIPSHGSLDEDSNIFSAKYQRNSHD